MLTIKQFECVGHNTSETHDSQNSILHEAAKNMIQPASNSRTGGVQTYPLYLLHFTYLSSAWLPGFPWGVPSTVVARAFASTGAFAALG